MYARNQTLKLCLLGSLLPSLLGYSPLAKTSTIFSRNVIRIKTDNHSHFNHLSSSATPPPKISTRKLQMSYYDNNDNNRNDFDLSKPTFDLFSFRTIRNDALLQYSSLNQSEPLRINLYLILTVGLFSFPTISEAVIGEEANLQSIILSIITGMGSFSLFFNECRNRLNQLIRIEKEMNAEYLKLSISTQNKLNPKLFDGGSGSSDPTTTLKSLRGKKRIVALCGTTSELKDTMLQFRIFRRRLNQANAIVIPVPTDLDALEMKEFWKSLDISETEIRSCQWLAQAQDVPSWVEYFDKIVEGNMKEMKGNSSNKLIWFGLNYNGRSFASGNGVNNGPLLLQILGQNLRPTDFLDDSDKAETLNPASKEWNAEIVNDIQNAQQEFYKALTEGDLEKMNIICSDKESDEVTEVSFETTFF